MSRGAEDASGGGRHIGRRKMHLEAEEASEAEAEFEMERRGGRGFPLHGPGGADPARGEVFRGSGFKALCIMTWDARNGKVACPATGQAVQAAAFFSLESYQMTQVPSLKTIMPSYV